MEKTCRCCLGTGAVEHIFNKVEDMDDGSLTYSEMITACSSFSASPTDGLPSKICKKCVSDLKQAYGFRLKCDKTYNALRCVTSLTVNLGDSKGRTFPRNYVDIPDDDSTNYNAGNDYKELKDIKVEFDDSLDIPLAGFDCDIGDQDDFLVDRLDETEPSKEDIKTELSLGNHQVNLRNGRPAKKKKLKKELKLKIKLCPECGLTFKRKVELRRHMRTHPSYIEEKYFCKICQKFYTNEQRHKYAHKAMLSKNKYECPTCQRVFHTVSHLNNHVKIHSEERKYTCEECGATFKQHAALFKHRLQHADEKYYCEFCSKKFKLKYNLTVHLRTHTNEKPFSCPVCLESFSTGNARNIHLDKHTDLGDLDKDILAAFLQLKLASSVGKRRKTKNLMCPQCGKLFKRSGDLTDHVNRHLGIKNYFCEICKKYVLSGRKHKEVHKNNRSRRCEICLKMFASQQSLKNHISIHDDARPFICDCGASFKQSSALYRHKILHEEKSFICHYCSKLFSTKYKLEIHIRIHTKERPYACEMCPRKFYTGNQLTTHKLRHSDYKGLVCDLCEKTFKTKSDLRQHLKVHEKIRKYPCKICSKNFFRSDHRNRHETTVHSMDTVKPENEDSLLN